MSQSRKKSARVVLVAVMVSISIVLFQNCGKKDGTVTAVGSSSAVPGPETGANNGIELTIHTASGLNSASIAESLDPEITYYLQAENVDHNGYACGEVVGVNTGFCQSADGAKLKMVATDWKDLGSNTIEKRMLLGAWAFGETVLSYVKQNLGDQPSVLSTRVKSPSELSNPTGIYIWHSLDPKGLNRIRNMNSNGVNGITTYYSHAINIGDETANIDFCEDIQVNSMPSSPSCVDAQGNRNTGAAWVNRALLNTASTPGLFQAKEKTAGGQGSVNRYYNTDVVNVADNVTCIIYYVIKGGMVKSFPLGFNGGTCK